MISCREAKGREVTRERYLERKISSMQTRGDILTGGVTVLSKEEIKNKGMKKNINNRCMKIGGASQGETPFAIDLKWGTIREMEWI
jgi:hypothetical protein